MCCPYTRGLTRLALGLHYFAPSGLGFTMRRPSDSGDGTDVIVWEIELEWTWNRRKRAGWRRYAEVESVESRGFLPTQRTPRCVGHPANEFAEFCRRNGIEMGRDEIVSGE
jgi:hypothetical protein